MADLWLIDFIRESNRIESIHRAPLESEIEVHQEFLALPEVHVEHLERAVRRIAAAPLRDRPGLDVRVGNHHPPPGGPNIRTLLWELLASLPRLTPFENHLDYETLHPFMDGNGRSGRLLWLWQMERGLTTGVTTHRRIGFLHTAYYQALDHYGRRQL